MRYADHYERLIARAKNRTIDEFRYYEIHHILPKCLDGTDDKDNLVSLYPEEHYIAHLLLAKMHKNVPGLYYACNLMCSTRKGRTSNKSYKWVRDRYAELVGDVIKNAWARKYGFIDYTDQMHKIWRMLITDQKSASDISKELGMSTINVRQTLRNYAEIIGATDLLAETYRSMKSSSMSIARAKFTVEQETRRIAAVKSMDYAARTEKTGSRKGDSNPMFGRTYNKVKLVCPHCGALSAKCRWHFEYCRSKKDENQIN